MAFQYLHKLQTKEKPIVKTGQEFIDTHIQGILPSDVILYAGNSGTGKTKLLYDTLDSILDTNVNKDALNYVTLQYELEMRFLNKILRDSHSITKRKKSEILSQEFTEDERELPTKRQWSKVQRIADLSVFKAQNSSVIFKKSSVVILSSQINLLLSFNPS